MNKRLPNYGVKVDRSPARGPTEGGYSTDNTSSSGEKYGEHQGKKDDPSDAKLIMENCDQKGEDDSCQQETEVVFPHQRGVVRCIPAKLVDLLRDKPKLSAGETEDKYPSDGIADTSYRPDEELGGVLFFNHLLFVRHREGRT